MLEFYQSFLDILKLNVPIVAAINGAAIGAGLCFACACDRRVAADIDKNILGFSFAKLGLTPGMGGSIFPKRLIGEERADDMLAEAYNITPRQALAIGMVEMVVPQKLVMEHAVDQASKLAGNKKGVLTRRIGYWQLKSALEEEARLQGASFLTERHKQLYDIFIRNLGSRSRRRA
jgi:enoyl-CoA hydratase/carnithine racemase